MRILLAQAEVELPPDEIRGHPAVRMHAKRMDKKVDQILLDQNHHAAALKKLDDGEARGRPDITHFTLLTILESPLAKAGGVEVAVHTRGGHLIRFRPGTRLPRGEARMHGLLAKVLRDGASQDKEPWVWVETICTAEEALKRFAEGTVVRLDEGGTATTPDAAVADAKTFVLGAYPAGPWSQAWKDAAPQTVSLWPEPLVAWAVAAELAAAGRRATGA